MQWSSSRRIGEQFYAADRNLPELRYGLLRIDGSLVENRTNQYPDIPDEHPEAGQDEKLGELPAGDVSLVRGTNREFFLPKRFDYSRVATSSWFSSHM